jgi:stage V sporulation protein AC
MNKDQYAKIVEKLTPKENKIKNALTAFFTGGLVGLVSELITRIIYCCFAVSLKDAMLWTCVIVIFIACLLTSLGFFDNWVSKAKCGLIIPTTGFAHSVCSAALDYKRDGFITGVGANIFKLAGSVILYG